MDKKVLKAPTNTTAETIANPYAFLVTAMSGDAVETQEAQGQTSLIRGDTLPSRLDPEDKAVLEANGFVFHGVVPDDEIFQYISLPQGWKKVRTDEYLYSDILDEKGRRRVSIFYKAAYYDRSASANLYRRISLRRNYDNEDKSGMVEYFVKDCDGTIIHTFEPIQLPSNSRDRYSITEAASEKCYSWIAEHFPDYRKADAYWDVESLTSINNG